MLLLLGEFCQARDLFLKAAAVGLPSSAELNALRNRCYAVSLFECPCETFGRRKSVSPCHCVNPVAFRDILSGEDKSPLPKIGRRRFSDSF